MYKQDKKNDEDDTEESTKANQRRDLLLTYFCNNQWALYMSESYQEVDLNDNNIVTDPLTCKIKN